MYLTNKILIIDNFYKDPDAVRQFALEQEFKDCKDPDREGNWPGYRSKFLNNINPELCAEFKDNLIGHLLEGVRTNYNCYFETNFQLCYKEHGDSWVHYDHGNWITHVGIIYLNPNPPANSGTLIYKFNEEHRDEFNRYAEQNDGLWFKLNRDQDSEEFNKFFTLSMSVPNVYNRAVVYNPSLWHKSDYYFGDSKDTGRLIQPFFATINYE